VYGDYQFVYIDVQWGRGAASWSIDGDAEMPFFGRFACGLSGYFQLACRTFCLFTDGF
jgi:hypothetical protein